MAKKTPAPPKKRPRKKYVTFTLLAPEAQFVLVTGTFCDWATNSGIMKKDKKGVWKARLSLEPGRHQYRFFVDGEWRDDPHCTERVPNSYGSENCVVDV